MGGLVLVVDDEPAMCTALARVVGREWTPIAATDVDAGLAVLGARPELVAVVTDYELDNGRSGTEILDRARALRPQAVRILISGALDEALVTAFTVSGLASHCLAKPFDPKTLLELLRAAIRTREEEAKPLLARGTERPSNEEGAGIASLAATYQPPRRHPRYPVDLAVRVQARSWHEACEGHARSLSLGGLCCVIDRPPRPGEAMDVRLDLPSGVRLRLPATVRHVSPITTSIGAAYRVGLEFEPIDGTHRDLLKTTLGRLREC